MRVVGIDVGLSGGVASLVEATPRDCWGRPMPLIVSPSASKARGDNREIDVVTLRVWLEEADLVIVEKVWTRPTGPGAVGDDSAKGDGSAKGGDKSRRQGGVSNAKLMTLYGEVRAVLKLRALPYIEVAPVTWKNLVLGDDYPHDKDGTIAFVKKYYPAVDLVPKPKRTPQDGIADAVALAHYGLMVVKNPPVNLTKKLPGLAAVLSQLRSRVCP